MTVAGQPRWTRLLASLGGFALIALAPGVALAGPRPAISPSKIEITQPIGKGESVRLPSLSVLNSGDGPGKFSIFVSHFSDQEERWPEQAWFKMSPEQSRIEAGKGETVTVRMDVPSDAVLGKYRVLLEASAEPEGDQPGGVSVGVSVAATVLFEVIDKYPHFYDRWGAWFQHRAPFSYIGVTLLIVVVALQLLRRRFRIRLSLGVERKDDE